MLPVNRSSNSSVSTHALHSSGSPATQHIGNVSRFAVMDQVKALLNRELIDTFDASTKINAEKKVAGYVAPDNLVMLAVLQAAHKALRGAGVHLSSHEPIPEEVGDLVCSALSETWKNPGLHANGLEQGELPEPAEMRLKDVEELQRCIDTSKSPFANIAPEHRWRMCLDPVLVDLLEKHVGGARENPLLPLVLDSEGGYLHGLLNGWHVSMKSLDRNLDAKLIAEFHQACRSRSVRGMNQCYMGGFDLFLGDNMTVAGRLELLEFARELRKVIPGFAVTSSKEKFQEFNRLLERAEPGSEVLPEEPSNEKAALGHPFISFGTMFSHMDRFVAHYHNSMQQHGLDDQQRLENIVDLCQKLERLHPFRDGNCRTFGILLLNHLLVRNGMPLTMLNDPNILDGWSRSEVMDEVKSGWARVMPYSMGNRERGKNIQRS